MQESSDDPESRNTIKLGAIKPSSKDSLRKTEIKAESIFSEIKKDSLSHHKEKRFFSKVFQNFANWFLFRFFLKDLDLKEAVVYVIDELTAYGPVKIKPEERLIIAQLLDFYEYSIDELKIPRNEILAVEENNLESVFELMETSKVSRIPVYRKNLDNIIGFLNIKDLFVVLKEKGSFKDVKSSDLIKKILFVPPSMKAVDLLARMKQTKIQIAVIVDEYGGTDGLITSKGILSEIVGDIDEEIDEEEIRQISNHELEVSGRVGLDTLFDRFQVDLMDARYDDVETLNGLILSICEIVPEVGVQVELPNNFRCKVLEVSDRMIIKALITQNSEKNENLVS